MATELGAAVNPGKDVGAIASVAFVAGVTGAGDGSAGLTVQLVQIRHIVSNSAVGTSIFKVNVLGIRWPFWQSFALGRLYHIVLVPHNNYDPPLTTL